MRVLFITLFPMNKLGGGETWLINAARSAAGKGAAVTMVAPVVQRPDRSPAAARLRAQFLISVRDGDVLVPCETMEWGQILREISSYDLVWLNQYLSNDAAFDVIANVHGKCPLLLTNLGHEPLRELFDRCYHSASHHHFVEISPYAELRLTCKRENSTYVGGGVWDEQFSQPKLAGEREDKELRIVSVGRVLPHKGVEHTIRALAKHDSLTVVGKSGDTDYQQFLEAQAVGRSVHFHGPATAEQLTNELCSADVLVASSMCTLYDGRRLEQAELLGLVILEAVAAGTLPIASSIPSFKAIMNDLGLADYVYEEASSASLSQVLAAVREISPQRRFELVQSAQLAARTLYLWDSYWERSLSFVAGGK